ncbi:MAG: LysR family transcriptional regulator [Gammaproteobacteria bacterium]|nr:LysR family transcriptional regulator [Gammaproteobacteria bacterium]
MTYFVRIVDKGSLSAAARELGKTLPALSRSLRALEERLGARLLTRTTRALSLTEFGQQYFEHCRRILHEVEAAESMAGVARGDVQGLVRITAPLLFGRLHVAPLVAPFLAAHPQVQVDMQLTDRVVSMVEDGIDLAIRIGDLQDSSLVAIPLGQVGRVVCAAPSYWAAHGKPPHPLDLKHHNCLTFRGLNQERGWLFRVADEERYVPIHTNYFCNDGAALISVARDGGGIVQMMSYQVAADLTANALTSALEHCAPHPLPVHAVYPGGRLLPAKVRVLLDEWVSQLRAVLGKD